MNNNDEFNVGNMMFAMVGMIMLAVVSNIFLKRVEGEISVSSIEIS